MATKGRKSNLLVLASLLMYVITVRIAAQEPTQVASPAADLGASPILLLHFDEAQPPVRDTGEEDHPVEVHGAQLGRPGIIGGACGFDGKAYIRVITLPAGRGNAETLALLKKAMKRAVRVDEKKLIIGRAAVVRSVDTLRWIVPYLDDKPLAQEACRTVVALAHHKDLMRPNQTEFMAALRKVVRVSSDQVLIDRATRYVQGL